MALATDGIIAEEPLPDLDPLLGDGLGQWALKTYAPPSVLLGNGLYALHDGEKSGHRGLPPNVDLYDLFGRLQKHPAHAVNVEMKMLVSHRLAQLHPDAYGGRAGQIITIPKAFDPFRDHHRYWEYPGARWTRLHGGWPMMGDYTLSEPSVQPEWVRIRNEELWCMVDAVEDAAGAARIDYRQLAVLE